MKKLLLLALFLAQPSFAQTTDCANCSWWDWNRWFPAPEISEWPLEYVKVEKVEYSRNEEATYCTRPVEMLDTVVIHHSSGSNQTTPQEVNDFHITRSSNSDPWYMIGYSFTINAPYAGGTWPEARVTEGRPLDIVGSHAGSDAFVTMTPEQKRLWDAGKIVCGKTGETFTVNPKMLKNGKIKANVTTLGIVVLGNFAPFSRYNPAGYPVSTPRYPTQQTLELAAKMSCQLQKKYPAIKKMHWHSMYNSTDCPGTLRYRIDKIKKIAKDLGCEFK